jgi:hypothetical protein
MVQDQTKNNFIVIKHHSVGRRDIKKRKSIGYDEKS